MSKSPGSQGGNRPAILGLERRLLRVRVWLYTAIAMIPLGCVGPLGLMRLLPRGAIGAGVILMFVAFFLPFIALGGALLMWADRGRYRRSLAVAEAGDALGLRFTEAPRAADFAPVRRLRTFEARDYDAADNLLRGTIDQAEVVVVDYGCAAMPRLLGVPWRRFIRIRKQTVFLLSASDLPEFTLLPRGWASRLRGTGTGDLELPGHDEFNELFALNAPKPATFARGSAARSFGFAWQSQI